MPTIDNASQPPPSPIPRVNADPTAIRAARPILVFMKFTKAM
jgi:hypothetical protein